jgi:pimeloyl-ACP methyl ester carboxylesterase
MTLNPIGSSIFGIVLTVLVNAVASAQAPTIAGHWEGEAVREGESLAMAIDFVVDESGARGSFTAPTQRVMEYPLDSVAGDEETVEFSLGGGALKFVGQLSSDRIWGTLLEGNAEGSFSLRRAERAPLPYSHTDVMFQNGTVVLSGSLSIPSGPGPHPAVIFVHGSGAETRWGTSRFYADQFARAGIATLIFDKRGTGLSTGDWRYSTYEDLADDALAGIHLLASYDGIDPTKIGIRGLSEGGMIGPLAAARSPGSIGFIIAAATYPESVWQIDRFRVGRSTEQSALTDEEKARTMEMYDLFLEVARGVHPMEDLEAASEPVRNERWYRSLGIPPRDNWLWEWYRWVGNFRSLPAWEGITAPVLLLYGERDDLVPVQDSIKLIESALKRAGNKDYVPLIVPRASHSLTISPEPDEPFEWWRVAPGIIDLEIAWVLNQTK